MLKQIEEREPSLEELAEFADNPEPRCPCILLVDRSGSMEGERIAAVNNGIQELRESLLQDELTASRAEIAVIAFNHNIERLQDFTTAPGMNPPQIRAGGATNISGAIHKAITILEDRKREYRQNGIEHYRPIMILITDGEPTTDDPGLLANISTHIAEQEEGRHLTFFTFAVQDADLDRLKKITPRNRPPMKLRDARIQDIFRWLSNSLSVISQSQPGDRVRLPTPDFLDY